jgi:hypothetical protein
MVLAGAFRTAFIKGGCCRNRVTSGCTCGRADLRHREQIQACSTGAMGSVIGHTFLHRQRRLENFGPKVMTRFFDRFTANLPFAQRTRRARARQAAGPASRQRSTDFNRNRRYQAICVAPQMIKMRSIREKLPTGIPSVIQGLCEPPPEPHRPWHRRARRPERDPAVRHHPCRQPPRTQHAPGPRR